MIKIIKLSLIFIIIIPILGIILYQNGINSSINENRENIIFTVNSGEGVKQIAQNLHNVNLIKSAFYFKVYAWRNELESEMQAGKYILSPSMTTKEIITILTTGQTVNQEREIKIIEGWNIQDVSEYLNTAGIISDSESKELIDKKIENWVSGIENLDILSNAPSGASLEGYLFPDTYRIYMDASLNDITKKMIENFSNKLTQKMREDIVKQGKTIHEIITLASIIEKEVAKEEDMAIVSGILNKRLQIGMRLEVDSTVNYITGKNNPQASYKDLEIDSPYNTYKYYGLPPGPISNPGLSSIKAAVYPKESPYLFYLNRQDTKETIFSRTYEEHLMNKSRYLN